MSTTENNYCQALKEIASIANSDMPLKKTLNAIARRAAKAMEAGGCSIMFLSPPKDFLITTGSYGLSELYLRKGSLRSHASIPEILKGKVVAIIDVSKDKRIEYPQAAETEKIASILGAPIVNQGEVIGEIRIYTHELRHFSQTDKVFLSAAANISTLALEKAELSEALSKDYKEMMSKAPTPAEVSKLPSPSLRPSNFAHPSEEEFAKLLDFYRIEWLYEPRSFPLQWDGDKITEMFTPDFYLPELDLYIELTTLKQSLVTDKHRKIRRLKQRYPEIKIRLLNKNDYIRLLAKYGYGPLTEAKVQGISRVLFSHAQIQRRVATLARHISRDYSGKQLVLVGILKGVLCFMSELMQHISLPVTVDFMAISYYSSDSGQAVKITKDLDSSISGLDVLMVEDIVDTGMTLNYVLQHLSAHNPASLYVCALLDKRVRRLVDVPLQYVGFEIPDEFVVGYGLDYQGQYRNLPFIGILGSQPTEIEKKK